MVEHYGTITIRDALALIPIFLKSREANLVYLRLFIYMLIYLLQPSQSPCISSYPLGAKKIQGNHGVVSTLRLPKNISHPLSTSVKYSGRCPAPLNTSRSGATRMTWKSLWTPLSRVLGFFGLASEETIMSFFTFTVSRTRFFRSCSGR